MTVFIKTGNIERWAARMEAKGDEAARELVKDHKRALENQRKLGKLKFAKVKRKKAQYKRFSAQKGQGPEAEKTKAAKFHDIFKD